jgi:hypothetical protein
MSEKQMLEEIAALGRQISLRAVLEHISKQRLTAEMSPDEVAGADYQTAYDLLIRDGREALALLDEIGRSRR